MMIDNTNLHQKIMNQFANHLRDDADATDESLALIQKVFQLEDNRN